MGLFKTKSEKALKKLQKLKVKYQALDKKLIDGTINKKEFDDYNKLKEEISTMAKKFIMKDGNLVLNEEATENKETKIEDKIKEEVQKEKNESEEMRLKMLEQERIKQQEELLRQQMAQTRQPSQEEIQQYMAMKQEQERLAQGPSQEEIDRYNEYQAELARRQELQMQQVELARRQPQPQPQQVEDRYLEVILNVAEMPELSAVLKLSTVPVFQKSITEAINDKKTFPFGDYTLHGKYIISYRFSEIEENEKQKYMEE